MGWVLVAGPVIKSLLGLWHARPSQVSVPAHSAAAATAQQSPAAPLPPWGASDHQHRRLVANPANVTSAAAFTFTAAPTIIASHHHQPSSRAQGRQPGDEQ